jgi:high-affinity Fe2+/Pb2+ permease
MVSIPALWLPILVSTILVFVASSVVWMALPHHKSDARRLPDEAAAIDALGRQNLKPGLYRFPWADSMAEMKDPAFVAKLEKGPVGLMTVLPSGPFHMGKSMGLWTGYLIVVGIFVAYVAGRVLGPGASYLQVFRVAGTVACLTYSGSQLPQSIWWGKPIAVTIKEIADGVLYGLLTAGAFGWLWPR